MAACYNDLKSLSHKRCRDKIAGTKIENRLKGTGGTLVAAGPELAWSVCAKEASFQAPPAVSMTAAGHNPL